MTEHKVLRLRNHFLTFMFLLGATTLSFAQVSGNVFRDFNANGIKTATAPIEIGLKDVTVNAYPSTGSLITTTTDALGNYSIIGGTGPYRIEFILPPFFYASNASVSNSTTQFVAAGGTANLGVNLPSDYCQSNPTMATNVYINGDNATGTSGTANTLVKFLANDSGFATAPTGIGTASVMGTTWGLAFQKETGKLFSAAYLKRHAGFGPLGSGGIYITNVATGVTSSFVNLNGLGTILTGANPHTNLLGDKTQPSKDSLTFHKIGKLSLGDMDISDDGKYLFVVNLFTREIHKIFINNPAVVPTAADVSTYTIPNPCGNTDYRPFGLKYYKGKLYLGLVCSAETSQNRTQMTANVYEVEPTTGVFSASPVLTSSLDFTRGKAWRPETTTNKWFPWTNTWTNVVLTSGDGVLTYPQPMLSDIEFDVDGAMILGFRDRVGDQLGVSNKYPNGVSYSAEVVTGGDIMRAAKSGSSWVMESNGIVGGLTSGTANNEGIGGSEFYKGDWFYGNETVYGHQEIGNGGLALLPGSGEVAMTALDPLAESAGFSEGYNSGGIRYLNNTNGDFSDGYRIYNTYLTSPGTFQKSNGLGDIEFLCNAAPIEIGNRVFMDTDKDGIQDANEMGIGSVRVELWKGGVFNTFANTDVNGQYIFTNLLPNTAYEIKILAANIPSGKELTLKDVTSGGAIDLADSDASLVGSDAVIPYTTGNAGENNHTLDFGFRLPCNVNFTLAQTNVTCNGANNGTITITATSGTSPFTYSIDDGVTFPNTTGVFTNLVPAAYKPAVMDAYGCVKKCN